MARKKLYGAALAAHNRKLGRSSSKALVRRSSSSVAKRSTAVARRRTRRTRTVTKTVYRRRAGAAGGGGRGVSGAIATVKAQTWDLGAAATYGYLTASDSVKAVEWRKKTLDHLPTSKKLGKPLSHGLLFLGAAMLLPQGMARRAAGALSHAALMRAAHNFGAAAGDTDAFSTMSGDDDDIAGEGAIDVSAEEVAGDDDDMAGDDDDMAGDDDDDVAGDDDDVAGDDDDVAGDDDDDVAGDDDDD